MSISLANSASTSDGPALNWRAVYFTGATACEKSPDVSASTAWAWVRLGKNPIFTSAKPAPLACVVGEDSLFPQPLKAKAATSRRIACEIRIVAQSYLLRQQFQDCL